MKVTHKQNRLKRVVVGSVAAAGLAFLLLHWGGDRLPQSGFEPVVKPQPLVMRGGDPYIRALMRTISASESNVSRPYSVLYGGESARDLRNHPDLCVRIVAGPNLDNCTTAAGRYQMLTTTWYEMAERYHPNPSQFLFWHSYSFEPEFQDAVVHAWLSDPDVWGADIPALLREGRLNQVLNLLSGTWTSLGYGIEDNSMTEYLPAIYQEMLREELRLAG